MDFAMWVREKKIDIASYNDTLVSHWLDTFGSNVNKTEQS